MSVESTNIDALTAYEQKHAEIQIPTYANIQDILTNFELNNAEDEANTEGETVSSGEAAVEDGSLDISGESEGIDSTGGGMDMSDGGVLICRYSHTS